MRIAVILSNLSLDAARGLVVQPDTAGTTVPEAGDAVVAIVRGRMRCDAMRWMSHRVGSRNMRKRREKEVGRGCLFVSGSGIPQKGGAVERVRIAGWISARSMTGCVGIWVRGRTKGVMTNELCQRRDPITTD
ncbi:hypothetical protein AcW1_001588 [Taiwanofungus camphoratus]|nr:hypothetical protein AcW1_001588 [Antrodia cinnamomea]